MPQQQLNQQLYPQYEPFNPLHQPGMGMNPNMMPPMTGPHVGMPYPTDFGHLGAPTGLDFGLPLNPGAIPGPNMNGLPGGPFVYNPYMMGNQLSGFNPPPQ